MKAEIWYWVLGIGRRGFQTNAEFNGKKVISLLGYFVISKNKVWIVTSAAAAAFLISKAEMDDEGVISLLG